MTNFLVKRFIKDSEDFKRPSVREAYGKLASVVGIVVNVLLSGSKILAGAVFGSISVTADGINNLSDAASSVITLIGFKIAGKPADEKHPYGHARMEYIAGLVVSFIILMLGLNLAQSSFDKILHPQPSSFSLLAVFVLTASILAKLWLAAFGRSLGKKIDSGTLRAAAADSLNDVMATSAVLLAMLASHFFPVELDGYMGLAVALFILYAGVKLIGETLNPLLGLVPDPEFVSEIEQKILGYSGVIGLHDLVVHNYGPGRCFVSVHVEVPAVQDILVSHDIIDNIEKDFSTEMQIHLVIHLDPVVEDNDFSRRMKALLHEILHDIDPMITMHDFRVVMGTTHNNLIFDIVVPPSFAMTDNDLRALISAAIQADDPKNHTVITVDRSYVSTTGISR